METTIPAQTTETAEKESGIVLFVEKVQSVTEIRKEASNAVNSEILSISRFIRDFRKNPVLFADLAKTYGIKIENVENSIRISSPALVGLATTGEAKGFIAFTAEKRKKAKNAYALPSAWAKLLFTWAKKTDKQAK